MLLPTDKRKSSALLLILLLCCPLPGMAAQLDCRFATLHYQNREQLKTFNRKVRFGGLGFSFGKSVDTELATEVGKKVNQICGRVQEILEMAPKDLKFNIQLLDSKQEVQNVYRLQYRRDVDFIAFYSPRTKTVYCSVKNLKLRVLAHEVAHAVIDHYFDKSPPVKIHEMLAQYVEENL